MEGISDGLAVDHCYYCALLFPDLDPCPRCENRLRYRSAHMRNAVTIEQQFVAEITRYRASPTTDRAEKLLTFWHELGEEGDAIAAGARLRVADLRHHFAACPGKERERE